MNAPGSDGHDARDEESQPSETGPATGTGLVLAAVAMVGMAVPVRQGVVDPAVIVGLGVATVVVVIFLGRRWGALDRRFSGVAAAGSILVVVLAAYALNQGVGGRVGLPGLGNTVSAVFLAFLAAGVTIGLAVADLREVTIAGLASRVATTAQLSLLALIAWIVAPFVGFLLLLPFVAVAGEPTANQEQAIYNVGFAIGTAAFAIAYVSYTDRGWSFFDLRVPSLRAVGWIVGGVGVVLLANVVMSYVFASGGVEVAEHSSTQEAAQNPELLYVMIPASILIIGPFEELLYRNVIQKSMYDAFSPAGAIVVSSVIFAAVHAPAASMYGLGATLPFLAVIFGLSLILGTIYWRTGNLVVPALVHGLYNAVVFSTVVL